MRDASILSDEDRNCDMEDIAFENGDDTVVEEVDCNFFGDNWE